MITQLDEKIYLTFIPTLYKFSSDIDQFYMSMTGNINLSPPKLIEVDSTSRLSYGGAGNVKFNTDFQDVRTVRFVNNLIRHTVSIIKFDTMHK